MSEYAFVDALARSIITIDGSSYRSRPAENDEAACAGHTLFFPGCSFINYTPSFAEEIYADLKARGIVDCLSLVCCGKIIEFEEDNGATKRAFQEELARRIVDAGVCRIVAACPNCVSELRAVLADYEEADGIEVVPLPVALRDDGYAVDVDDVKAVLAEEWVEPVEEASYPRIAFHDSCPDRRSGEFAESVRALFPPHILVEKRHNRSNSLCCGSLANAFGRPAIAVSQAEKNGEEGIEAQADSLVTYCMSCSWFLSSRQAALPVHHYLEFILKTRLDWEGMPPRLSYRFLFEETHGTRDFCGAAPSL